MSFTSVPGCGNIQLKRYISTGKHLDLLAFSQKALSLDPQFCSGDSQLKCWLSQM